MRKDFIDRVGMRYGRLVVTSDKGKKNGKGYRSWECKCDCGSIKTVYAVHLVSGTTQSCGCLQKELSTERGKLNGKPYGVSAFNTLYQKYKKRSLDAEIIFEIEKGDFLEITQQACYYCGNPPSQSFSKSGKAKGSYVYTGIERINRDFGYIAGNIRTCCWKCNRAKAGYTEQEFFAWIIRTIDYQSSKRKEEIN